MSSSILHDLRDEETTQRKRQASHDSLGTILVPIPILLLTRALVVARNVAAGNALETATLAKSRS